MEIGCTTLGITNTRLLFHFIPPPTHTLYTYIYCALSIYNVLQYNQIVTFSTSNMRNIFQLHTQP